MADIFEFDASFNKLTEDARYVQSELERMAAEQRTLGDETRAAALDYMAELASSAKKIPKAAPSSVTSSADFDKANAARQKAIDLDRADLTVLEEQTALVREQAAIRARLESTGSRIIIPQQTGGRAFEQTLPGQLAAEQAALRKAALESLGAGISQEQLNALRGSQLIVPEETRYTSYSQTAGAQAKASADAAAQEAEERGRIAAAQERAAAAERERLATERELTAQLIEQHQQLAYQVGLDAATARRRVPGKLSETIDAGPVGLPDPKSWTAAEAAAARYNTTLGEYDGMVSKAGASTREMDVALTRLGMADAEASDQMRKHGALTTEFLGALARGETTVSEFGYQIGATIGKFAGWTAAAAGTYAALGAVAEFGKGAIDAASSVQQLTRTIDNLDPNRASQAIQAVSRETNTSMKEAGDAVFAFSRTFHNIEDASSGARLGLAALKLDNVSLNDSVRASTAITQQYGGGLSQLRSVYNELSAAQREYNARISDMIPLLQKSSGAVHNAGGDLTQLIQLGTYFSRVTQLSGSQVGTAFYRSASTFLNPSTTKGQSDIATLKELGINFNGNWTQTILDALVKSVTLSANDRSRLANAIFGPQYGGRVSAGFNPNGLGLLQQITGPGRGGINPESTRGSLQTELSRELATPKQQLDSFLYAIQRLGAAFANTGAINVFTNLLSVATAGLDEMGHLLNTFGELPSVVKESAVALLAFRSAMLFFSRTRLGSSAPLITRVPGFRPSDATRNRATLAIGTRQAIQQSEQDLAQTQATNTALASRRATLRRQALSLEEQVNQIDSADAARQEEQQQLIRARVDIGRQIYKLDSDIIDNEIEANAQAETLRALKAQRTGLTATSFSNRRYSDEEVNSLAADAGIGTSAARARANAESDVVRRVNAATAATTADTAAREANAAAVRADTEATALSTDAEVGRFSRLASGAGTALAALDPMLIALVAVPLALSQVTKNINDMNAAARQFRAAGNQRASDVSGLHAQGSKLAAAERNAVAAANETSPGSSIAGGGIGQQVNAVADYYDGIIRYFEQHARQLAGTQGGRAQISQMATRLKQLGAESAEMSLRGFPGLIKNAEQDLANSLQQAYANIIRRAPILNSSPFANFSSLSAKQLEQSVQYADDYSKVFGTQGTGSLKQAAYAYTYLANKFSHGANDADLQAVATAQQNFVSAVTKSVQDMLHAAQSAPSEAGQNNDLSAALATIEHARQVEQQALDAIIKEDRGNANAIRKAKEAANQVFAQLNDQLKSVLDAQTQLIQTQSDLAQSQVTGTSPEADITRARIAAQKDQQIVAKLRASGANWQDVAKAQSTANNAQQTLAKDITDNNNNVGDALDKLSISSVTGISPEADLTRARLTVTAAANKLARDRASGAGEAAIINDQAALYDAERGLNQQIQQRSQQIAQDAAALIQAQTAYQQSQTLDPIRQAREQLAGDIRAMSLIKPQDYQSRSQYQAALLQARAKINNDRTSLNDQIVQTDMSTLQFELDTGKIGDQQYINGLEQILRTKRLTLQEKQQIESEIYRVQQGLSGSLDLNVGNIKLPSVYEIKRAIGLGQRGQLPGGTNMVVNHTSNVTVNVYGAKGASAVGHAIDAALNTSISSVMRAKGVV